MIGANAIAFPRWSPATAAGETLAAANIDGGTGLLGGNGGPWYGRFHRIGPVTPTQPPIVAAPSQPGTVQPMVGLQPGTTSTGTETAPASATGAAPATTLPAPSTWESIASAFGWSAPASAAISAASSAGAANQMMGPQYGFAPATTTTTSGGGGSGIVIFIALAIVGVLVYMHFRKRHEAQA